MYSNGNLIVWWRTRDYMSVYSAFIWANKKERYWQLKQVDKGALNECSLCYAENSTHSDVKWLLELSCWSSGDLKLQRIVRDKLEKDGFSEFCDCPPQTLPKKNLPLGDKMGEIWGRGKTIQRWTVLHILCGISTFDKAPISGRDAVRTPTRLLLQSGSMPLQLSYLANWTLLNFLKYNT